MRPSSRNFQVFSVTRRARLRVPLPYLGSGDGLCYGIRLRTPSSAVSLDEQDYSQFERSHPYSRGADAQPGKRGCRHSAQPVGRDHRRERQRQEFAGLRYAACRRPAAIHRFAQRVHAAVLSTSCSGPMSIRSKACNRPSPSTRARAATTPAAPSAPSPKCTITCGCCSAAPGRWLVRSATR